MKSAEKIRAISLRKRGLSYRKIRNKINISKGTLSIWLRDISLTKLQRETLLKIKDMVDIKGQTSTTKTCKEDSSTNQIRTD